MNQCSGCGEDFSSIEIFDRHRVGVHEYTYLEGLNKYDVEDGRRCLDTEEMELKQWKLDEKNRWYDPKRSDRARVAFASGSPER